MGAEAPLVRLFLDPTLVEPQPLSAAGGRAVLFSAPAPHKETPNEDAAAVVAVDDRLGVLLVADGMGGGPGGESAAKLTLQAVADTVVAAPRGESLRGAILDGIERANRAVLELGIGAGTTLAAIEIDGETVRPYHVGDSAILVVGQRGKLKLQTIAHSPVGYALESGLLDEDEALHHDERHLVSNMIGAADMRIEVGSPLHLAPRDTVLLASDGLFDNLTLPEIVETVRKGPLAEASRSLSETCIQRMLDPSAGHPSKPDDFTALLYRREPS